MAFALFVRPVTDGQVIEKGNRIVIKGASYLTLISSTATGFLGYDQMPLTDRKQVVQKAMQQVMDAGTDVSKLKRSISKIIKLFLADRIFLCTPIALVERISC